MIWLLACKAPVPPPVAQAPSAAQVMDRWVQARGPTVPHSTWSSASIQGSQGGLRRSVGEGFAQERLEVAGLELGWGHTEAATWTRSPGLTRALGGEEARLAWEASSQRDWREVVEVELLGEDEGAWILERRWTWGAVDRAWFEQDSGLLRRVEEEPPVNGPPSTLTILRYEEHLGMQLPAELIGGVEPLVVHERLERVQAGAEASVPELALRPAELPRLPVEGVLVQVGGQDQQPVPMLVDTGASASVVPRRGAGGLELSVSTPTGSMVAWMVPAPDLAGSELGAAIAIEGLEVGLIGRDLLSRGVVLVEAERVSLEPDPSLLEGLRRVPLRVGEQGQPILDLVSVDGHIPALLDTGAPTLVNRRGAALAGLPPGGRSAGAMSGLDGAPIPAFAQPMPELLVEGQPLCWPTELAIAELPGLDAMADAENGAAIVGLDALPAVWALDLPGGALWLGGCS